ncbi:MAG: glycosyltransferase family 39 protein, partial [Anaerolineae bacterium]|nr:glycosyltransferase family 39 protein [Anaerolineae bacterium]
FLASLALRLLCVDHPIVVDSVEWLRRGARFLLALQAHDWARTYGSAHPGVTNMWLIAAGLAGRAAVLHEPYSTLTHTVLPRDVYPALSHYIAARVPFALVTSLCAVLIYRWATTVHGRETALIAAILLTLEPFWLAYNRVITTDALQGNLMILALLAFLRYLHDHGRRWVILSGILSGLAIATKLPALLLAPTVITWAMLWEGRRWTWERIQAHIIALLTWGILALTTLFIIWPALWVTPIDIVHKMATQLTTVELGARHLYYMGRTVDAPGAGFYPLAWLIRTSPLTLIAALGTLIGLAFPAVRRALIPRRAILWITYILIFTGALTFAETKFDRYLIPIYPAVAFIAADGLRTARRMQRRLSSRGVLIALAAVQAIFLLLRFPDLQAFYNPLIGGARTAQHVLMLGNGEGLEQVGHWLSREGGKAQTAASWYPSVLAPYFSGRTIELNQQLPDGFWPWASANHVVFYINQVQRTLPNPQIVHYFRDQHPEFVVRLAGVEYAWSYPGPRVPPGPLPPNVQPLNYTFEGQLRLIGWEPPENALHPGGQASLRLYWETLSPPQPDLSVFIGLWDEANGRYVGRHDRPPTDGFLPINRWQPGERVRDAQIVAVAPDAPPGTYQLEVALFSPKLGRNLTVTDANGQPVGDRLHLIKITVNP